MFRNGLKMKIIGLGVILTVCTTQAENCPHVPPLHTVTDGAAAVFSAVGLDHGQILCVWTAPSDGGRVMSAYFAPEYGRWFGPRSTMYGPGAVTGLHLLRHAASGEIWLFTAEDTGGSQSICVRRSANEGATWTGAQAIVENAGPILLGSAVNTTDGRVALSYAEMNEATGGVRIVVVEEDGAWRIVKPSPETTRAVSAPILIQPPDAPLTAYYTSADHVRRYLRSLSADGGNPGPPEAVNLPSAVTTDEPKRTTALLALPDGVVLAAGNDNVVCPSLLNIALSYDGGRTWPLRRTIDSDAPEASPTLVDAGDNVFDVLFARGAAGIGHYRFTRSWILEPTTLSTPVRLFNVVPPLNSDMHRTAPARRASKAERPIADTPFFEHVRHPGHDADWPRPDAPEIPSDLPGVEARSTTPVVRQADRDWAGTEDGLYFRDPGSETFVRHPVYGVDGPPSNVIAGIVVDSRGTLWVATPAGLAARNADATWRVVRGRQGLPWEELTCMARVPNDGLWLGSTRGAILYLPYAEGRQWYYRAGKRYLADDHVLNVALSPDGRTVYLETAGGPSRIVLERITLYDKAEFLEARLNERHRRLGMPSPALYNDQYTMDRWVHGPQPSDGLWTGYHVAAMSLAYSLTLEDRYRESARVGMEALYLLQNVTGIPGLVARSVVAVDEPAAEDVRHLPNWHLTDDGRYLWRDDVSSDQLDGHFLAFYAYFEHIAQFDPMERRRLERQIRQVLDYILDNNYTVPDWHGRRTMWGWWAPELVNDDPNNYIETGLYSLMMLSFLKNAYYVTGDGKYLDHFFHLIEHHDFLSNLLLEKKLFPDELNHSDDQLAAVAYYPILQLEHDPFIRETLHRAIRRHALVEAAERNSFFAFVYATIDADDADLAGGVRTLREFPRDRRNWRMENSHRADVVLSPHPNRGGAKVLMEVLPYDEHQFERWNEDPYQPDDGGDGRLCGSGEHYLIPYWIARYHNLIGPPTR